MPPQLGFRFLGILAGQPMAGCGRCQCSVPQYMHMSTPICVSRSPSSPSPPPLTSASHLPLGVCLQRQFRFEVLGFSFFDLSFVCCGSHLPQWVRIIESLSTLGAQHAPSSCTKVQMWSRPPVRFQSAQQGEGSPSGPHRMASSATGPHSTAVHCKRHQVISQEFGSF